MKKYNILQLLQLLTLITCLCLLIFKKEKIINLTVSEKTIEHRIAGKETIIKEKGKVIDNSKLIINELNNGLSDLQIQLEAVKNARDTFNIVQIQDTMIHTLYKRDREKDLIIASQDTIINAQRYIINSKDTIITLLKVDLKKVKRQRNGSIILNILLSAGIILKP
jgi:hypothetical protein